jgi:hypothetical protein
MLNLPPYFKNYIAQLKETVDFKAEAITQPKELSEKSPRPRIELKVPVPASFLPAPTKPLHHQAQELLADFKKLRRGGNPRLMGETLEEATEDGLQYSLMTLCVADCKDTPETLEDGIKMLRNTIEPAITHGAGRHATIATSEKTLVVLERKCRLLGEVVFKLRNFRELEPSRDAVIKQIFEGSDPHEVAGQCFGMREALKANIHHPHGRPQDAESRALNFSLFIKTFGLPAEHESVLEVRAILKDTLEGWAEQCSEMCKEAVMKAAREKDPEPRSKEVYTKIK